LENQYTPDNVFYDVINYLETNSNELDPSTKIGLLSTIFEIRSRAAAKNPEAANYDIKKLIDNSRELFNEDSPALEGLIHALSIKYPFDYPKAKEELHYLNLLDLSRRYRYGYGLFNFYDPRALEDDMKYDSYLNSRQYTSARMFTSILRHLEIEFKAEWLNKLQTDELRILRNAIYASYGYKFTNPNLRKYFYEENNMTYICRNGRCGQPKITFDEKLLNEIDRKNLVLIKELEKNRLPR
jgi:hypothetical protein